MPPAGGSDSWTFNFRSSSYDDSDDEAMLDVAVGLPVEAKLHNAQDKSNDSLASDAKIDPLPPVSLPENTPVHQIPMRSPDLLPTPSNRHEIPLRPPWQAFSKKGIGKDKAPRISMHAPPAKSDHAGPLIDAFKKQARRRPKNRQTFQSHLDEPQATDQSGRKDNPDPAQQRPMASSSHANSPPSLLSGVALETDALATTRTPVPEENSMLVDETAHIPNKTLSRSPSTFNERQHHHLLPAQTLRVPQSFSSPALRSRYRRLTGSLSPNPNPYSSPGSRKFSLVSRNMPNSPHCTFTNPNRPLWSPSNNANTLHDQAAKHDANFVSSTIDPYQPLGSSPTPSELFISDLQNTPSDRMLFEDHSRLQAQEVDDCLASAPTDVFHPDAPYPFSNASQMERQLNNPRPTSTAHDPPQWLASALQENHTTYVPPQELQPSPSLQYSSRSEVGRYRPDTTRLSSPAVLHTSSTLHLNHSSSPSLNPQPGRSGSNRGDTPQTPRLAAAERMGSSPARLTGASNSGYKFLENLDADEDWSTLPSKKKRKPEQRNKPSGTVRCSGAFKLPGLGLAQGGAGSISGMPADSKKRVITFMPPPLTSKK